MPSRCLPATLIAALLLTACGSGHGRAAAGPTPAAGAPLAKGDRIVYRPFAPDSVWNLPLRADVPLNPDSASYVAALAASMQTYGPWINTATCDAPTFRATARTPTQKVTLVHPSFSSPGLVRAWERVPIPAGATPADCGDQNFAVEQRQPDGTITLWEFYRAERTASGWTANHGGVTLDMQSDRGFASNGMWSDPTAKEFLARRGDHSWNTTATSASMVGGVINERDLERRSIDHALSIALHDAAKSRFFFPAQRSDGGLTDQWATPEGAQFRLDPSVDVDALPGPPMARMIARSLQRYGMVVRDRTLDVNAFYSDLPASALPTYRVLMGGLSPKEALADIPWDRLQLVDRPLCTGYEGCGVQAAARIAPVPVARVGRRVLLDTRNSALSYPRARVRWDLDGRRGFETDGDRAAVFGYTPKARGARTVRVRIVTTRGETVTARRRFTVR